MRPTTVCWVLCCAVQDPKCASAILAASRKALEQAGLGAVVISDQIVSRLAARLINDLSTGRRDEAGKLIVSLMRSHRSLLDPVLALEGDLLRLMSAASESSGAMLRVLCVAGSQDQSIVPARALMLHNTCRHLVLCGAPPEARRDAILAAVSELERDNVLEYCPRELVVELLASSIELASVPGLGEHAVKLATAGLKLDRGLNRYLLLRESMLLASWLALIVRVDMAAVFADPALVADAAATLGPTPILQLLVGTMTGEARTTLGVNLCYVFGCQPGRRLQPTYLAYFTYLLTYLRSLVLTS